MRKKIAAGNWKMNTDFREASLLAGQLATESKDQLKPEVEMIIAPPYPHLYVIGEILRVNPKVHLAGQNVHQEKGGAYTGEVSAAMLKSVGCEYVIIGHWERRQYFKESNALLASKVRIALEHELLPIFCIGEVLEEREAGKTMEVVSQQVKEGLFELSKEDFGRVVIAYEPVWAIGTGKTATPAQAQEVHAMIRGMVKAQYGAEVADNVSILYGGSVKPANAKELFSQPDIDGGLVGGASLKADFFLAIAQSF